MKLSILFPVIMLPVLYHQPPHQSNSFFKTDTTVINHVLDGKTAEWPSEKFATDDITKIHYAIDNSSEVLFLAIKISDNDVQKKIMRQGLTLFIDSKGKKKENRGVEFPLKTEYGASIELMKIFGLDNSSESPQNIKTEGTINIAIAWDSSFVMNIEYHIPLKVLDQSPTELNNKKISIGWKIDESDMPVNIVNNNASQPIAVVTQVVGVPAGSRPPNNNRNIKPTTNNNSSPQSSTNKSQSFWVTHTISF